MCQPAGYAEVWYGQITGPKVELATDAVVRTATAADLCRRPAALRSLLEGDLAVDARSGKAAHASAPWRSHVLRPRLRRVARSARCVGRHHGPAGSTSSGHDFLRCQPVGKKPATRGC